MKVVKRDMKHGVMVVKVEDSDDLWHLEHVIQPGDFVKTRTMRKVAVKAGGEFRMSEKKPMVLGLSVEKKGFDATTGLMRVTGKIVEGPPDTKLSSYHTIEIEPGTVITIGKKRWGTAVMKRVQESGTRQPKVLVCVIDREEADIALIGGTGIRMLGHIESEDPEDRDAYHSDVLKFMSGQEGFGSVVVAGPGFEASNLLKYARGKGVSFPVKVMLESASHTGINGINEVLKRSGDRILRETRIGRESEAVEEVLSRIKSDGLVEYGKAEVGKAIDMGAVEKLIVSRERISDYEHLMEKCERMRGAVRLVSADHQAGEQLLHLGGIAALLRFRIE